MYLHSRKSSRPATTLGALALTSALALSACSGATDGSPSNEDQGGGVPVGSTQEEYIAAFENVDPITIHTQTPAPQGSTTSMNMENYVERVEEWSDGKITFEISYSNAIADPADIDDALNDGRLDLGQVLPIYEPSDYPATTALIEAGVLNEGSAVAGVLQSNAWSNEVAFSTPEIMDEWDQAGLVPLVPVFNSGTNGLFCSSPHTSQDDLAGTTVSAGGTIQSRQVEALGGSPVSIAYTELFESLQRGVVSCAVSSQTVALLGGYLPEAPYAAMDTEATFADAPGGLAFSKTTWESLPLPAQQLFWDSLDVFIGQNITQKIWPNSAETDTTIQEAGGEVAELDPDARDALLDTNSTVLNELRQSDSFEDPEAFIETAESTSEEWTNKVIDLGYPEDVPYEGFAEWWENEEVNIDNFMNSVMEDIYAEHRPE